MALTLVSQSSGVPLSPAKQLNEAVDDFQRILTEDQRAELKNIKSIPDADAVLVFTAQLDSSQRRRGRSIATRLHSVLQSVREFSTVIDTFVSSNPEIAALVWGSVKLTIQIALNFTSYYEAFSNLFMGLASHCPRFAEYQVLYPSSVRLQAALCNFHASLIRCCKHAVEAAQRPWKTQFLNALWQSFEQEFKSDIGMIQRCGDEVREEISLAKARAEFQDQELQKKEREAASGHRRTLRDMLSRTGNGLETIKELQLQQKDKRRSERRRQLLDSLSSYDRLPPFKRACKERHYNTAQWVFDTAEFCRWKDGPSTWIWCSGKSAFYQTPFPLTHGMPSLSAETVIRSIIRQSLDPVTLSEKVEASLAEIDQNPAAGVDTLTVFFRQRLAQSEKFFIFIDALDEFEPRERRVLLEFLASLDIGSNEPGPKVFLAGRESLSGELKDKLPGIERISMASAEAKTDIAAYIKETLQERVENQDLVVGDQSLISDIQQALTNHADGM
ncbi:hypothetical protein C8A05DRAFT_46840 [Staphylotrichum tortipilum]|uniref:Uncharacterized protein n=1 Tax=Staphylotrichum tortipilum TaxID=2831512 RepID=A0AAN6MF53_9PEZI|nr:hypothetical protein C8A05DRAFT_46840 [Staphylotrichum longicolle]